MIKQVKQDDDEEKFLDTVFEAMVVDDNNLWRGTPFFSHDDDRDDASAIAILRAAITEATDDRVPHEVQSYRLTALDHILRIVNSASEFDAEDREDFGETCAGLEIAWNVCQLSKSQRRDETAALQMKCRSVMQHRTTRTASTAEDSQMSEKPFPVIAEQVALSLLDSPDSITVLTNIANFDIGPIIDKFNANVAAGRVNREELFSSDLPTLNEAVSLLPEELNLFDQLVDRNGGKILLRYMLTQAFIVNELTLLHHECEAILTECDVPYNKFSLSDMPYNRAVRAHAADVARNFDAVLQENGCEVLKRVDGDVVHVDQIYAYVHHVIPSIFHYIVVKDLQSPRAKKALQDLHDGVLTFEQFSQFFSLTTFFKHAFGYLFKLNGSSP